MTYKISTKKFYYYSPFFMSGFNSTDKLFIRNKFNFYHGYDMKWLESWCASAYYPNFGLRFLSLKKSRFCIITGQDERKELINKWYNCSSEQQVVGIPSL